MITIGKMIPLGITPSAGRSSVVHANRSRKFDRTTCHTIYYKDKIKFNIWKSIKAHIVVYTHTHTHTRSHLYMYDVYDRPPHTSQWKPSVGHEFSDDCSGDRVQRREKSGKRRDSGVIFSASFDPCLCIHILLPVYTYTYTRYTTPSRKGSFIDRKLGPTRLYDVLRSPLHPPI